MKNESYCHIIRKTHDDGGAYAGGGGPILYEKYKIRNYLEIVGQYCSTVSSINDHGSEKWCFVWRMYTIEYMSSWISMLNELYDFIHIIWKKEMAHNWLKRRVIGCFWLRSTFAACVNGGFYQRASCMDMSLKDNQTLSSPRYSSDPIQIWIEFVSKTSEFILSFVQEPNQNSNHSELTEKLQSIDRQS